jgi:hypothetical protein
VRGLLQATFALSIEQPAVGFRLHPRVGLRIWRGLTPRPAEGTLDIGLFGGWSHRPMAFRAALFTGVVTGEGPGAHHALLLASLGHSAHALTPEGHVFQFSVHLLGGWAYRSDEARVLDERYGVDSTWSEEVHGAMAGTITSVGILFDGRVGPTFEVSYLQGSSRGLAIWHFGFGVAVRLGPEITPPAHSAPSSAPEPKQTGERHRGPDVAGVGERKAPKAQLDRPSPRPRPASGRSPV